MTKSEFDQQRAHLQALVALNQRYQRRCSAYWLAWDQRARAGVTVLAVAAAFLSVAVAMPHAARLTRLLVFDASITAVASVGLHVFPLRERAHRHSMLHMRWVALREDLAFLGACTDDPPAAENVRRLNDLVGKVHRTCALDPKSQEELGDELIAQQLQFSRPDVIPIRGGDISASA